MRVRFQIVLLSVQVVMCVSASQQATAQPSKTPTIEPRIALTSEQVVSKMLQRNLERAQALVILSVEPLTKNKLLYRGRVWVDAEDFAVVRIEAAPAKNTSFWTKETRIEQDYAKVGDFWLPLSNRSSSAIRPGGHASLTIDYQEGRVRGVS